MGPVEASQHRPFEWTPSVVETLRVKWEGGGASEAIAAELGTTKGAVVGKARRLGLVHAINRVAAAPTLGSRGRAGMATQLTKSARAARAGNRPERSVAADAGGRKALKSTAWLPLPGSSPVPLLMLSAGQCRWPVGDAPTLFCAEHAEGVYCAHHKAVSMRAS